MELYLNNRKRLGEMGLTMKEWRVLVSLEYEWRIFRIYRKITNWFIGKGFKLSSRILCALSKKMDKHGVLVSEMKHVYENQTGKIIVFYY